MKIIRLSFTLFKKKKEITKYEKVIQFAKQRYLSTIRKINLYTIYILCNATANMLYVLYMRKKNRVHY